MSAKGIPREKANRTAKIQIMTTESVRRRLEAEAGRLGLSISSVGELILGQYIANKGSQNLVNDEVV